MPKIICFLLQISITAGTFWGGYQLVGRKKGRMGQIMLVVAGVCAIFISFSVATFFQPHKYITVSAIQEKNEAAEASELTISRIELNGEEAELSIPVRGKWNLYEGAYRWFEPGDQRAEKDTTDSITYKFDLADQVDIIFWGNKWKGIAKIEVDGVQYEIDTYRAEPGEIRFSTPSPTAKQILQIVAIPTVAFAVSLLALCAFGTVAVFFGRLFLKSVRINEKWNNRLQKLLKYQFLFEELVSRDFKKKYKRTALGMAWSVLSPLLTLLIMRLVFTQFFGRAMEHYTIYLFCGNLVFSYFNESTTQGMTSLGGNASIFTKVNVPKYLFLFSKNVQTLINFGLTLIVLFIFCMVDNITFTWKFVCLLYPVVLLLLFNIGVGLILSALFVFFKDIQYLWSVFSMLLMYMSAIFYTIDSYKPMVQNLFLLNPVYLFIRYFRKIVIEASVPTVWFHLLMLLDVALVLSVGCWMYKKYNTKFLYYV